MEFSDDVEVKQDRCRTKNFVPQKYLAEHKRYWFIIGSFVVGLVLLIIVTLVFTKISSKTTQNVDDAKIQNKSNIYFATYDSKNTSTFALANLPGKLVLIIDGTDITAFDYESLNLNLLHRELIDSIVISAFDVNFYEYMYWSKRVANILGEDYVVERSAWDKGEPNSTVEKRGTKVTDLAVDRVTGNLYAVDEDAGSVFLIDFVGSSYITLKTGLVKPRKIVLDPEAGLMFILQQSSSIVRANMDGSQMVEIVKNNVTTLTIDTNFNRLYWVSNNFSIESSDYKGKRQKPMFVDIMKIETLALFDNRLFWSWPSFGNMTDLFSCEILKDCVDHSTYNVPGNVTSIWGYQTDESKMENPCVVENDCEQVCFMSGMDRKSCACREGWLLNSDKRSCEEALIFV